MKTPKSSTISLIVWGLLATTSAQAALVVNPSFEANYNDTWPHYGSVDSWTGGSGVNKGDGPFHNNGTPVPDSLQMAFMQGTANMTQSLTGLTPGARYWVQFWYDARACCGGSIDLVTKVNDVELDRIANVKPVTGGAPYLMRTVAFKAADDGNADLTFSSISTGDATVLIDAVSVLERGTNNVVVGNPSFEASGDVVGDLGDGTMAPNNLAGWTAEGTYGVNVTGANYADNGTPPDQDHVLFLKDVSSVKQLVKVVASKPYQLSFAYNAKTGNSPHLQVKVDDKIVFETDVTPVGAAAAYRTNSVSFTSTDVTATIQFLQTKAGDQTVLLDNVKLVGEIPPDVEPVSLTPEVAELSIGDRLDITLKVPAEAVAANDVTIGLLSTSIGAVRFLDASGALTPRATVKFTKGGVNQKTVTIQGLARGAANIQVTDASGLAIKNQTAATVVSSPLKNPSFDSTSAPADPGYGPIPGWTAGPQTGLNTATQPFADNGNIPDRTQVAFIQGSSSLAQEARGLIPGTNYWLQFFYNIRNCCGDNFSMDLVVNLGGKEVAKITGITPVGAGNPYYFHQVPFVADAANALLEFKTTATGDATLLLDGVNIVQRDPGQVVVKNPSFEASGSLFPYPGYFVGIAGWDVSGGGRGVNIDGVGPFTDNGRANAGDVVLFMQGNGASVSQNLTNLTDARKYIVGFLMNARGGGAEDTGISVTFQDNSIFEDAVQPVGGANPYYVRQATFTAAGTEGVLKFAANISGGDHTLLLDNVVVIPETGSMPVILSQPRSVSAPVGGSVTLGAAAVGSGTLTYQWKKDGTAVAGQTQSTLQLDPLTLAMAGNYAVDVKNSSGTVTSMAARVTVLEPISGLFDTGVDQNGVLLADGAVDPHYTLVTNIDNAQSTTAYAQDSNLYPIVAGPWLANSDLSRWIGPRADPSAGTADGNYVYRTTLDLTGYDPSTVVLSGNWAADNSAELFINGVSSGLTVSGFGALTAFSTSGGFKSGVNQLDFTVNNGAPPGPTGLRIEGFTATGAKGGTVSGATMAISLSAQNVTIAWPVASTGYVLQSSAQVNTGWADDSTAAVQQGNQWVVNVPVTGSGKFYRLIKR